MQKTQELLKLVPISASRHQGVTIMEAAEVFGVTERTAQRMMYALKEIFPSLDNDVDSDRR